MPDSLPQWTEGPWQTDEPNGATRDIMAPSPGGGPRELLATAYPVGDGVTARITAGRANAKLIAAAPDLYAALKGVLELISAGKLVRDTSSDANPDWAMRQMPFVMALGAAEDALAKARGEKP